MTPSGPSSSDRATDRPTLTSRRRLLAAGAGLGVTALAGCAGGDGTGGSGGGYGGGGGGDTSGDGGADGDTGTFRLLISDQPVAIDEFDRLDVTLTSARIFPAGGDGEDEEAPDGDDAPTEEQATDDGTDDGATTTAAPTTTGSPDGTETAGDGDDGDAEADDTEGDGDEGGDRGFQVLDLGGKTVDLTQVVGDRAVSVFEGGLPAGEYTKVELRTSAVEGVVDGEPVEVKLPSEKLQITKPFSVTPGGTLSFVFDITVVRKGNGGYNLLPVVGESGVVGRDVEVEEVGPDGDGEAQGGSPTQTEGSPEPDSGGPPEDAGGPPETDA